MNHWKTTAKLRPRYKLHAITIGSVKSILIGDAIVTCAICDSVTPLKAAGRLCGRPARRARARRISRAYVSGIPMPRRYAASAIMRVTREGHRQFVALKTKPPTRGPNG